MSRPLIRACSRASSPRSAEPVGSAVRDPRRPPVGPPLFFVDDLDAPELSEPDAHHLGRVLRVRAGAPVTAADGQGSWRPALFAGGAKLDPDGSIVAEPAVAPHITIGFALTKGDKPELVVQKLTELGADRIVAFTAARSVVVWDADKEARQVNRWRTVAREAAMQCRRAQVPVIHDVATFAAVARLAGAALAAPGGDPPRLGLPTVLIGPEGGWSAAELAAELPQVALGDHVLRAETAAIAACSVLAALRSRLAGEVSHPAGS
jgi:16S rRNA (uracil1498-N3)-methyltransferase